MTRHAINPAMNLLMDGWDGGDPWGSAINALFDVAEVMYSAGIPVPSELKFRPSPFLNMSLEEMATEDPEGTNGVSYDAFVLASEYLAGNITDNDLRLAALTLNRYCDLCRAAGLDY